MKTRYKREERERESRLENRERNEATFAVGRTVEASRVWPLCWRMWVSVRVLPTEPSLTESSRVEPSLTESSRVEPSLTESNRVESSRVESSRADIKAGRRKSNGIKWENTERRKEKEKVK